MQKASSSSIFIVDSPATALRSTMKSINRSPQLLSCYSPHAPINNLKHNGEVHSSTYLTTVAARSLASVFWSAFARSSLLLRQD